MMLLIIVMLFSLFSGCSFLQQLTRPPKMMMATNFQYYENKDYLDQLIYWGEVLPKAPGLEFIRLSDREQIYLQGLISKMVEQNELLLKKNRLPQFFIIKDKRPFYFSLPEGRFFISLGLLQRYILHEGDLISLLTVEMIKSYRYLYYPLISIPTGYISLERMMALVRLNIQERIELNQWVFFVMKRSGYDPYSYLSWIQKLNKNSGDFSMVIGDTKNIVLEEYYYKAFIIEKKFNKMLEKNSSQDFYFFMHNMQKINL